MNVRKSDVFIADVEQQFEWYTENAGREIAERYLDAVESTCRFIAQYPQLGPFARFNHLRLREWRFFVVFRPFKKHLVFYAAKIMLRAMHGHRHLQKRLLEKP